MTRYMLISVLFATLLSTNAWPLCDSTLRLDECGDTIVNHPNMTTYRPPAAQTPRQTKYAKPYAIEENDLVNAGYKYGMYVKATCDSGWMMIDWTMRYWDDFPGDRNCVVIKQGTVDFGIQCKPYRKQIQVDATVCVAAGGVWRNVESYNQDWGTYSGTWQCMRTADPADPRIKAPSRDSFADVYLWPKYNDTEFLRITCVKPW